MKPICIFLWLCMISMSAFAQQTGRIETDRPDQTECPFIVKKGYFQAEIGFNRNVSGGEYGYFLPTSLWKFGLLKRLELRLVSVLQHTENDGLNFQIDAVGTKIHLFNGNKWLPRTSIITHIHLNNLTRDESERNNQKHSVGDAIFTFQNDFGKGFGVGYNFGTEFHSNGALEGVYRIAPNTNIGKNGYAYVEVFGRFPSNQLVGHWMDGGYAYYVSDDLKLDFSVGKSLTNSSEWYSAIGVSFRVRVVK